MKQIRKYAVCLLIAILLAGAFSPATAEASLSKPANCRFTRWNNKSFTACRVSWKKSSGASYYEIEWTWMDGSNFQHRYQYGKYNVLDITGLKSNRIYKVRVRALKTSAKGKIQAYSSWSNTAFITPLPKKVKQTLKSSRRVKLSWDKIHSARGYKVYMTTKPTGTWHLVKTTEKKSSATSVTISKYRGSRLSKNKRYYVRIVPRVKSGGKYRSVHVPSGFYQGGFILRTVKK